MSREVPVRFCESSGVKLPRSTHLVLLARTERKARYAWQRLQSQFDELHLQVNQEKSRLSSLAEGFAFLGFEFRRSPGRPLYMFPRQKARKHIGERVRDTVRSVRSSGSLHDVIKKLNPVLLGWCTYFRVGNSNRVFQKVDKQVRDQVYIWLRRKHQCRWRQANLRWPYRFLVDICKRYRMGGQGAPSPRSASNAHG